MDYVYDIVLNFQPEYYDFYEWQKNDKIINVKKVPIYKITNKDYLNIKHHDISFDIKSLPKDNKLFLVTSGLEVMGLLIDNNGQVLKKSSLIAEEADDILNDKNMIKFIKTKYIINHKNIKKCQSRITKEKYHYINTYLKKLDKEKDKYLLKYLYYDIYNQELDDPDQIYQALVSLSKTNLNKIYDGIKRVSLELKRP